MSKLSELCQTHIKRYNYEFSDWVDFVVIQKEPHINELILIYFISERYDKENVTTIIWVDKKGNIKMIDGRFSLDFYGLECLGSKILKSVINNEKIILDIKDSLKIDNVFDSREKFRGEKNE